MINQRIKISEKKYILDHIFEYTGHDFRNYTTGSIMNRIDRMMSDLNQNNAQAIIKQIEKHPKFRSKILDYFIIPESEFLRTPPLWAKLSDTIQKKLRKKDVIKIFLPYTTTGEELHSLRIILNEAGIGYKCHIIAHTPTKNHKKIITTALYSNTNLQMLKKNIEVAENGYQFNSYFSYTDYNYMVKTNRFEDKLEIKVRPIQDIDYKSEFDLILFRNKLIYLNKTSHFDIINKVTNTLTKKGYLVIGSKETLGATVTNKYKKVSKHEAIYKKIVY